MKKILIVLNAVKYNRGSEALIRGLIRICKRADSHNQLYLVSSEFDFEDTVRFDGIDGYINRYMFKSHHSFRRICAGVVRKVFRQPNLATSIKSKKLIRCAEKMDIVIIIGADNYDKSYGMYSMMHELNQVLKSTVKGKLYLYDCSLEKKDIDSTIIEDFNLFDLVTVRENITLNNLTEVMDKAKIRYYSDPAFLMEAEMISLPQKWQENNMIGINLSSLVLKNVYGSNREVILESYYQLVEFILQKTRYNIVFIPHVMQGQDLSVLKMLHMKYQNSGRVILIEDENLSAPELKYLISQCRFFIGARTHATIAAYSSYIPTLVLGYSVKSVGIAQDLFGTDKNYVISTRDLKTGKELKEGFEWILENEEFIKKHLLQRIPEYKELAWKAAEII
ncbi:MAG: polysaccharide pyruvyl transferase family protein [Lachnospiraceae bacterium]|nr:polysaccharide pyruvyl transferase family protein [Lachnospiraceae bacterium]